MEGIVTDIQRFSVHDGPGIRTTVFLKGCNLRCAWCHNPETIQSRQEIELTPALCIGCGECAVACKRDCHDLSSGGHLFHRDGCVVCGECVHACFSGALALVGRRMTAAEVLDQVMEDASFYETSGGGVTVSGGEPMFQREFTGEILRLSREKGVHTAIETNLAWPWPMVEEVLAETDLLMMDLKLVDGQAHQRWTGAPNTRILENVRHLQSTAIPVIVRTPLVTGVNDSPECIEAIVSLIGAIPGLQYYELLPYHPLGSGKAVGLGREGERFAPPAASHVRFLAELALRSGIPVKIAGRSVDYGDPQAGWGESPARTDEQPGIIASLGDVCQVGACLENI